MLKPRKTALERRKELQEQVASIGINRDYISQLVDTFYLRIRNHPLIGPIFEKSVGDNWDNHLEKMKLFWESVTMNLGTYSGKPVVKHKALTTSQPSEIHPWHFNLWLSLFETTLKDTAPNSQVVDHFMIRANRMSQNLQKAMFSER